MKHTKNKKKDRLWLLFVLLVFAIMAAFGMKMQAQTAEQTKLLHPPQGSKVAVVVFEDLQCPDCANANPLLEEAARKYDVPLVRYDFPLPRHVWAQDAAVLGRYFDTKSQKLGDEFRDAIFKDQPQLNKENLHAFAEQFARKNQIALPPNVDPDGKLAAEVQANRAMGLQLGVSHTPTIYVVNNQHSGTPFVEVVHRSDLFQMIEAMRQEAE
jgi:protein-disulfide isomerase